MGGTRDRWWPAAAALVLLLGAAGAAGTTLAWRDHGADPAFLLQTFCGGLGLLFALWMLRVAEHPWAARCYVLAGAGFFLSASNWATHLAPDRSDGAGELIAIGGLLLFYGAFVAMFLRFPRPLISQRKAAISLTVAGLLAAPVLIAAAHEDGRPLTGVITTAIIAIVALIAAQTWTGRRDARVRLRLGMLALVVLLGAALHLLTNVLAWEMFAGTPLALIGFPINTLIFIGIGLTTGKLEPFAAGGWATRLMVAVGVAVAVLLLFAVTLLMTGNQPAAFALSLAIVACVWTPMLLGAANRAERRRDARSRDMLERAAGLAFAVTPELLEARWHGALRSLFDPASIRPDDLAAVSAPTCAEDGVALRLPAFRSLAPVTCRNADQGRRLFTGEDVATAASLIHILDQLIAGRDKYVEGREAERERIARDLHDDVNGLLVTSLLRDDAEAMRRDVRGALLEIRGIVRGAAASNRSIDSLLAELRHEAATRLEAARIALEWTARPLPDLILDPSHYRHILSIMRESITNILRHAGASRVCVEIGTDGEWLDLSIQDDGSGATDGGPAGSGLANSRRRAELIGGSFDVIANASGFAVKLRVPLEAASG